MIKQKMLDKPILIPCLIDAEDFAFKTDPKNIDQINIPTNFVTFAVLPKDYTLMSINIEILEDFDKSVTADIFAFDNQPNFDKTKTFHFAKAFPLTKNTNVQSSVVTTLKKNQSIAFATSDGAIPTKGKAMVRIMMFAPSGTYFEI